MEGEMENVMSSLSLSTFQSEKGAPIRHTYTWGAGEAGQWGSSVLQGNLGSPNLPPKVTPITQLLGFLKVWNGWDMCFKYKHFNKEMIEHE